MPVGGRWVCIQRPSLFLGTRPGVQAPRGALSLVRQDPDDQQQWLRKRRRGWRSSLRSAAVDGPSTTGAWVTSQQDEAKEQQRAELEAAMESYIAFCQDKFGMPGSVRFSAGFGGLPMVTLRHPNGAEVDVYCHGATVTGWRHVDGRELLYLSPDNEFDGEEPISGGIPIAFPQVGPGPLPTHGFLRHLHWSVVETFMVEGAEDPCPTVSFYADTDPEWEQLWPHKFEAVYSVTLMQPEPPQPKEDEVLAAWNEGAEFDTSSVGGEHEDWGPNGAGPAAAADDVPRQRRGRPGSSGASLDSLDEEEESDAEADVASTSKRRAADAAGAAVAEPAAAAAGAAGASGAAGTGGGSSSTAGSRYVYGGMLPSTEALNREAAEGERRSWQDANTRDDEPACQLRCILQVNNSGDAPFSFTTALQTHLTAEDIAQNPGLVKTVGLRGKYCLDYSANPMRPSLSVEDQDVVVYGQRQLDRVYVDCDGEGDVMHCPGSQSHLEIKNKEGFRDLVVQNPALTSPQEARYFVALHSARVARPVTLQPGESWYGEMVIRAHRKYWDLLPWEEESVGQVPAPPTRSAQMEDAVSTAADGFPDYEPFDKFKRNWVVPGDDSDGDVPQ